MTITLRVVSKLQYLKDFLIHTGRRVCSDGFEGRVKCIRNRLSNISEVFQLDGFNKNANGNTHTGLSIIYKNHFVGPLFKLIYEFAW